MKRKNDLMEGRKEKGHTAQCLAFNKRLVITEEEEEKGKGLNTALWAMKQGA